MWVMVIHSGPGTPTMPLAWAFQSPWEDFFTVVHWEQRGVGKNDATTDRAALLPTMTMARTVADGEAVIDHLCRTLGKEKVALLGFFWGAMMGVHLAQRCPGKISVYAGTGQAVSTTFEPMILAETLSAAQRAGDAEAAAELSSLNLSPRPDGSLQIEAVQVLRRIARRYDGMWCGRETLQVMMDLAVLAPEYSDQDVEAFRNGAGWIVPGPLLRDMAQADLRTVTELTVPVVLLQGRYDLATPHADGYPCVQKDGPSPAPKAQPGVSKQGWKNVRSKCCCTALTSAAGAGAPWMRRYRWPATSCTRSNSACGVSSLGKCSLGYTKSSRSSALNPSASK